MFNNAMLRAFIEKTIQAEFCFTALVFSEIKELTENVFLILHH